MYCAGKGSSLRLRDQKVDVFRHNDIAEDKKDIVPARLFQGSLEEIARCRIGEIWQTVVTTEGEEMELTCLLIAL